MNELYKIAFDTIAHIIKKWNNDEEAEQTDYEYLAEIENCVNAVGELPDNITNGDMIKAMFPNCRDWKAKLEGNDGELYEVHFVQLPNSLTVNMYEESWWNAPYKGGTT